MKREIQWLHPSTRLSPDEATNDSSVVSGLGLHASPPVSPPPCRVIKTHRNDRMHARVLLEPSYYERHIETNHEKKYLLKDNYDWTKLQIVQISNLPCVGLSLWGFAFGAVPPLLLLLLATPKGETRAR